MSAPYSLRAATTDDRSFLLHAKDVGMRPWVEATWGWDEEKQAAFNATWLEKALATTLRVIEVDGEAVGYLGTDESVVPWKLNSIVVLPELQGNGLGTRIVQDYLAQSDEAGVPVTLQVLHPNPARRLYERLGFVETGRTDTHAQMRREPGGADPA